jgi:hypothetical protein
MDVTRTFYRQGISYAPGTIIDGYLDDKTCAILYEKWKPEWPEPLVYPGNQKAITAEMILEVSFRQLVRVYKKKRATLLRDVAQRNV